MEKEIREFKNTKLMCSPKDKVAYWKDEIYFSNFNKFTQLIEIVENLTATYPGKNEYILEILLDFMNSKNFEAQGVLHFFLVCRAVERLDLFLMYYSKFMKRHKVYWETFSEHKRKQMNSINDLFFTLVDSEVSLLSGNVSEFIDGQVWVIEKFSEKMSSNLLLNMVERVVVLLKLGKVAGGDSLNELRLSKQ